jgi:hypothetical protein
VTRGFMGPLGGFWPKLGRKRVTGWKQRSCVPEGRMRTNKQTRMLLLLPNRFFMREEYFEPKKEFLTCRTVVLSLMGTRK